LDAFSKELLGIWAEVNLELEITSKDQFLDQQLWHNSLIKIASNRVFKKLVSKGNNLGETSFRTGLHLSFVK